MMVSQAYTISTVKNAVPPRVKMSQYDSASRTITFTVVDGSGTAVDLTGKTATVEGTRIDGHAFVANCTISGSTATFTETIDMTNAAGDHPAELVIRQSGQRLGTMNFILSVEAAAMDENASITPEDESLFNQLYGSVDDAIAEVDGAKDDALQEIAQGLASGAPLTASTVAAMTDTDAVYLYTGSESGYTAGSWYYYNGSAWVIGGVYGSGQTDATLTLAGVAADAKATGERLEDVESGVNDFTIHEDIEEGLINYGYSFSRVQDYPQGSNNTAATRLGVRRCGTIVTLNMSQSVSFNIRVLISNGLERSKTVPGAWEGISLESGKTYRAEVKYLSGAITGQSTKTPAIVAYEPGSSSSIGERVVFTEDTYVREFTAGNSKIRLCLYVGSGTTYTNAVYQVKLYEYTPEVVDPVYIGLMQYNCGKWSYGAHEDMTSANFQTKIDNYKKLFCKYHPDVMGIQEWVDELEISGLANTQSMNDLVFDEMWQYNADFILSGSDKGRTIKSKWELTDITRGAIDGSDYGYSANTVYSKGYINYYGRRICIVSTAFIPTSSGASNVTARANLLPLLLNLMQGEDYAFLICDANNVGAGEGAGGEPWDRMVAEGDSLAEIAEANGFKAAMGTYIPYQATYKAYLTPSTVCPIDQIYYKNNGKTLLVDYQVLMDEYDNLASDHAPCFGKFLLL